jgi:Na+/H+ antiporter NhaC
MQRQTTRTADSTVLIAGLALLVFCVLSLCPQQPARSAEPADVKITVPQILLKGIPFNVEIEDEAGRLQDGAEFTLKLGDDRYMGAMEGGAATVEDVVTSYTEETLAVVDAGGVTVGSVVAKAIPSWLSILPSLFAIAIALAIRQVIPALFLGIWIGAALVYGLSVTGIWLGLLDTVAVYGLEAVSDGGHASIIIFSMMIGGMVGIIAKNGGTMGIVNGIVHWAKSPKRGQLTTWLLGVTIFFDDLSNTMIVGNTMRPITDKLRISREKLAYIVDSTAAPIATIALVTTWIGFEVGLIEDAVNKIDYTETAYSIFLNSILYSFYPILTLFFVFLVAFTGRDFGPMLKAERRARSTGQVARPTAHTGESPAEASEHEPKPDIPHRAYNAFVPVLVLVFGTLIGIYVTGKAGMDAGASLRDIIGNGDSYVSMMWSSLLAVLVAAVMSRTQGILTVQEIVDSWFAGVRSMLLAMIILVMAWSLSAVNGALHTGDFLISTLGDTLPAAVLPLVVFVLSALTAFATGSSWGVMGIMMPLVVPLAWAVMGANDLQSPEHMHLFYSAVSAVLAGAVWGDHCSPISDTTILSSMASGCDHIDHVRTQIPYALAVGAVALLVGTLPAGYGVPWYIGLLSSAVLLFLGLRLLGKRDEADRDTTDFAARENVKTS